MSNAFRAAVRAVSRQIFGHPCVKGGKLIRLEPHANHFTGRIGTLAFRVNSN
ncbi:hypothetical protein [Sphingomonas paucimobilis]|uniref:Uncharacterized protein n=1 Tax=Sphingomonas paucimobilis TaxID=13689 RepID=A0A7T3AD08_SPHPI|nr:hypothetical protein [Sphingomonas paucimobilis]QPT09279.1 hypothetical protein I6G38_02940 [Sphingomonas paucimobilis]